MKKKTNIKSGDKFGRLTALQYNHTGKHHRRYFLFRCDCGQEKVLQAGNVTSGNTKSCGCLAREIKKAKRLPGNRGVINHLILQHKRHARNRNLPFRLSYKKFSNLIRADCFYCGSPPSNIKITKNCREGFTYNGIDRINPKRGYFANNVVPCCSLCNRAKSNLPIKQFKEWIKRLNAMAEQWGV